MATLTLPRRAAVTGIAALLAPGAFAGPLPPAELPACWIDRHFPHDPGRPSVFRPCPAQMAAAPLEVPALASALCSATWREPLGGNLYDSDPEFKHEWERAAWLLLRWCRVRAPMPANMAGMAARIGERVPSSERHIYVPTERTAERVPRTVEAAASMMSSVAGCNHLGESAYDTDPAFEEEWLRCGAFSLKFAEMRRLAA